MSSDDQQWPERAACRAATDEEIRDMFATVSDGPGGDKYQRAFVAKYCNGCPVKAECRAFGDETQSFHGVFGGLTERQREEIRRKARPGRALAPQVDHCPEPGRRRGVDRHRWIGEDPCEPCAYWLENQAIKERQAELVEAQMTFAVSA